MNEEKRREYEAREKAIRDYDWQMESRWRKGHKEGLEQGLELGMEQEIDTGMERKLVELVCRKLRKGKGAEEIAEDLDENLE